MSVGQFLWPGPGSWGSSPTVMSTFSSMTGSDIHTHSHSQIHTYQRKTGSRQKLERKQGVLAVTPCRTEAPCIVSCFSWPKWLQSHSLYGNAIQIPVSSSASAYFQMGTQFSPPECAWYTHSAAPVISHNSMYYTTDACRCVSFWLAVCLLSSFFKYPLMISMSHLASGGSTGLVLVSPLDACLNSPFLFVWTDKEGI